MITRDLKRRFTASEALRFFEENISQMSALELEAPLEEDHSGGHLDYDQYDRWKELPLDLQKQWAMYREPPIPRTTLFLRWLCRPLWVYRIVAYVRWLTFTWMSLPKKASVYLVGLRLSGWNLPHRARSQYRRF